MRSSIALLAVLSTAFATPTPQFQEGTVVTVSGTPFNPPNTSTGPLLGNYYNHWTLVGNKSYDLTRRLSSPITTPYTIPMLGSRKSATIEPTRSALVIIDMQNYFLHPDMSPKATGGRTAVQPTLNMIDAFRAKGMKVLWTNWGIDDYDLLTLPPSFLAGFSGGTDDPTQSFGSDMGVVDGVEAGGLLMRGSWNARPYGPLDDAMVKGVADGTDLYFNKNRLSGLWGAQTPLGLWLMENQITTLFFGGVNADQCVWGTFLDAYYKGFDVVYVEDISATTSPEYAEQMVKYNANLDGFLANSTTIISALNG